MTAVADIGAKISFDTLVRADVRRVYEAFATAAGLDAWWTDGAIVEPWPGGVVRMPWVNWGPNAESCVLDGDVVEVCLNERFIYRWWTDDPSHATTVTLAFEPVAGGTVVRMREYGYPWPDSAGDGGMLLAIAAGWGEALTLAKLWVEHGVRY